MDSFGRLPNELIEYIATLYHTPIKVQWYHVKNRDLRKEYIPTIIAWSIKHQKILFCQRCGTREYPCYKSFYKHECEVQFDWWAPFQVNDYINLLVDKPPL